MEGPRCSECGRRGALAKIRGKYYCYECGSRVVREHIQTLLQELRNKKLVS